MEKPWSYSGAKQFENCPHLYDARYESKRIPFVETPEMAAGKRTHQKFYLRAHGDIPLPTELEKYEPWLQKIESFGQVHAELKIAITRDLRVVDYFDPAVWHRAGVDLCAVGATTIVAFDYKTGNPNFEDPFQGADYSACLLIRFPHIEKVAFANVWLRTGKLGQVHTYTREKDLQNILTEMYSRADDIARARAAGKWPKLQSPLCKFCPDRTCEFNRSPR